MNLSFCCAVGDQARFERCLRLSLTDQLHPDDEFLVMKGTKSLASTYGDLEQLATNEVGVYLHEDLIVPPPWVENFRAALIELEQRDPNWGLLGISGTIIPASPELADRAQRTVIEFLTSIGATDPEKSITLMREDVPRGISEFSDLQQWVFNIRDSGASTKYRYSLINGNTGLQRVQAIDSIVIAKKKNNLIWDAKIPLFGAGVAEDIGLQATTKGQAIYVIPLYVEHETVTRSQEDRAYMAGRNYVMEKWPMYRPIITTAGIWY